MAGRTDRHLSAPMDECESIHNGLGFILSSERSPSVLRTLGRRGKKRLLTSVPQQRDRI